MDDSAERARGADELAPEQLVPPAGNANQPPGYGYPPAGYGYAPPGYGYQQPPRPRRRWPLIAGLVLAFVLALGIGAVLGSALLSNAQAARLGPYANVGYGRTFDAGPAHHGAAGQGQCAVLTVSSVSGSTITAKAGDGSTVTIHTTSSTQYLQNGQTVSASTVKAGSQIHVAGTHNSDGSITATRIEID